MIIDERDVEKMSESELEEAIENLYNSGCLTESEMYLYELMDRRLSRIQSKNSKLVGV